MAKGLCRKLRSSGAQYQLGGLTMTQKHRAELSLIESIPASEFPGGPSATSPVTWKKVFPRFFYFFHLLT
jgi:hypothetical protein